MITIRDYIEGKADIALGSFGVPKTQRAKMKEEKPEPKEKEQKEE